MRIVSFCLALLVVAGCNKPRATTPDEPIKPVATLTVEELLAEYQKNEVGADQKFKDKPIQVTGTVAGVKKAPPLGYFVGLGSPQEGDSYDVMCFLDKSAEEDAGKLKAGDKITLMGRCDGKAGGLQLKMSRCWIVK
jgi:tRNA_anti-like